MYPTTLNVDDRVVDLKTGIPVRVIAHCGYELFTASPVYIVKTKSGVEYTRPFRHLKFVMRLVRH